MAKRRLEKTFADYVAIALSPVLIMLLVGSLVFFLLEILYDGQHDSRMRWMLFWFVLASVLVARISIEQGAAAARVYGLGVAIALSLFIFKFVDSFVLGVFCLLGFVWWCTDKLTWDCTLIDDTQDASGEGLLQVAGIDAGEDSFAPDAKNVSPLAASRIDEESSQETSDRETGTGQVPFWKTMLQNRSESAGRPHAPGLWVVYFSLAALPLFGLGQLLIPREDEAARQFGFKLLWIFVAAALGLLLTTSFLGLRRYLRQRKVQMPASIAGLWVGMGGGLIVAILLLCLLLPRPQSDYSIAAMIDRVSSEVGKASSFAFLNDDAGKGEGQRTGEGEDEHDESKAGKDDRSAGNGKKGSQKARSGNAQGKGKKSGQGSKNGKKGGKGSKKGNGSGKKNSKQGSDGKGKKQEGGKSGKKSSGKKSSGKNGKDANSKQQKVQNQNGAGEQENQRESSQQSPNTPQSNLSEAGNQIAKWFKWLLYALIAVVLLYYAIKHRSQLLETLRLFWQELVNFWNDLFGRKRKEDQRKAENQVVAEVAPRRRSFADFSNPFTSGAAQQMQPEELVRYTFEALEAWAYEQRLERKQDQTPLEFSRLIAEKISMISKEVVQVAKLYVRVAYADYSPTLGSLGPLERLWRRLGSER